MMNLSNIRIKTGFLICVSSMILVACGESDLDTRFKNKIEAAKADSETTEQNQTPTTTENETESEPETNETVPETNETETVPETNATLPNVVITSDGEVANIDGMPYDKIFGDEFRGTEIDASKWNTSYQWGSDLVINEEEQYYVDTLESPDFGYDPFQFDGESLIITASETPAELSEKANGQSYLSGAITSSAKFTTTYGYIEMRAKMPAGYGLWSGFWMLGAEFVDLKPQLFIMEHDGGRPNSVFHNYNYHDTDGNLRSPGQWEVSAENATTEFHTYGVRWDEQVLVYYVDGVPKYRIEGENVSRQAMYLIANLAVGGVWPGSPQSSTEFPSELHIDYIRAYRKR